MAKYDEKLSRMLFLMEDKKPQKAVESSVKYHANGADGKVYGILREGNKFYIKQTESGKENIAESYDYIGGFMNKKENEFRSYNDATKHLELKLISLNEAYGKSEAVSAVEKNNDTYAVLTEDARKDLNRMHEIFENSMHVAKGRLNEENFGCKPKGEEIGKPGDNAPFDEKAKDCKDGKCEGGKKEGVGDGEPFDKEAPTPKDMLKEDGLAGVPDVESPVGEPALPGEGEVPAEVPPVEEPVADDPLAEPAEEPAIDPLADGEGIPDAPGMEGMADPAELDLESLLEEFEKSDLIAGDCKVLTHQGNPINGTENGVDDEKTEKWKRIEEEEGFETKQETDPQFLNNYHNGYNDENMLDAQGWKDRAEDSHGKSVVKALTESIYRALVKEGSKNDNAKVRKYIARLVNEEVTKLDVWGKHPRYGHEPFSYPDPHEVMAGTADRDFNDDSTKGRERYGKKIGKGDPFDQQVEHLTDQAMTQLKENLRRNRRK